MVPVLDLSKVAMEISSEEEEDEDESYFEMPQHKPTISVSSDDDPENQVNLALGTDPDDPKYRV